MFTGIVEELGTVVSVEELGDADAWVKSALDRGDRLSVGLPHI